MKVILNYLLTYIYIISSSNAAVLSFWDKIQMDITKKHYESLPKGSTGLIQISGSEAASLKNYKLINQSILKFENSYRDCINKISDVDFSETSINICVGSDFKFYTNDIKYEQRKILSRVDSKIDQLMLEGCYKEAGLNLNFAQSCDLLQSDINDILWTGLNFYDLIRDNRARYTGLFGNLSGNTFDGILRDLELIYTELENLRVEFIDHRDLSLIKLKTLIDRRTKHILINAKNNIDAPQPKIFTHSIQIDERVVDDPNEIKGMGFDTEVVMDGDHMNFGEGEYLDEDEEYGDHGHAEYENELPEGKQSGEPESFEEEEHENNANENEEIVNDDNGIVVEDFKRKRNLNNVNRGIKIRIGRKNL